MPLRRLLPLALAVLLIPAAALAQGKPDRRSARGDTFYRLSDSLAVRSIALLPVGSYDNKLPAEKLVAAAWGPTFGEAGYRWVSAASTRVLLGDSLANAARKAIVEQGRPDSLAAAALCAKLRVDAVLGVRIDRWDQVALEWNQSGKPSTTVQLSAAVVDASGRRLWSGTGSETAEGLYQDASANPIGVNSSGLGTRPVTGQGGPPEFAEVLNRLLTRWKPQFPPKSAAAGS